MVVRDGRIAWIGARADLPAGLGDGLPRNSGGQRWETPGLVDCHTNLVYGGHRAEEFEMRLTGVSYAEIARRGGGIVSTVKATREAPEITLLTSAARRLRALMREGVTTDEIGSLEVGKQADFVLWDIDHPAELAYRFGANPCHQVVKRGRTVYTAQQEHP